MIRQSQSAGEVTEELVVIFQKIATGLFQRYGWCHSIEEDDAVQEAVMVLILKLDRMDPDKNCFSYLSTIVHNCFRCVYRRKEMEAKKIDRLKHQKNLPQK